ncbi:MAG TPA: isochorismatase family cysteine hydrolase [Terriglobia bacterium]|nr:isochorismatase family cysteine hydrolase [Terriglobia bacterium]
MKLPSAFFDVDTQFDFMDPAGNLHVPHAEDIIPNLARLMSYARARHVPVLSSADAHAPGDPEFKIWPPHCVAGTRGQQRIRETSLAGALTIPMRSGPFIPPEKWPSQIIIEKDVYETSANPNFDAILAALGPRRYVVFGVATEYCVRADVLALRERHKPIALVVDAIKAITEEDGRRALEEMAAAGADLVTTADVCR